MKSVLISIHPKWCELIANGKKNIEVRKSKPKLEVPFKCYIYATKNGRPLVWGSPCPSYVENNLVQTYGYSRKKADTIFGIWNGKVIGEFICNKIYDIASFQIDLGVGYEYLYESENLNIQALQNRSCLDMFGLHNYLGYKTDGGVVGYGWNIRKLEIYDEPKKLSEFTNLQSNKIVKAPQSWIYVDEEEK